MFGSRPSATNTECNGSSHSSAPRTLDPGSNHRPVWLAGLADANQSELTPLPRAKKASASRPTRAKTLGVPDREANHDEIDTHRSGGVIVFCRSIIVC